MNYTERIPKPDPSTVNTGLSACKASTLFNLLGNPRADYSDDCQPITNSTLKARIISRKVGPFKVTGLDLAVESLTRVIAKVKAERPELYKVLGSAGMLCCRYVRGSTTKISNHSWGTAIDITIGKKLDIRGDGTVQRGLLGLYPFFHAEGWYWGVEFPTEDGMHFELANETVQKLLHG